jgi:colicin import membrane protein
MNRTNCSEQDFYLQRKRYGQLSFLIVFFVVILHVFVFAGSFMLPRFFERKPIIHEVMTIDLVSIPEPAGSRENISGGQAPGESANISPITPEPPLAEPEIEAVVIDPVVEPTPDPVVTAKPVSLTPLKRKKKIAEDTRLEEDKLLADQKLIEERMRNLRSAADRRLRQAEEQTRLAERKKREEQVRKREIARSEALARQARDDAEKARRELAMLHQIRDSVGTGVSDGESRRGSSGSQAVGDILLQQYTANIHARVEQYWQLPGMRQWPKDIKAVVEFTVHQDGSVTGLRVSESSGDSFFDSFAKKTVKKAVPMPPIPVALRRGTIDYGLIFDPTGVQSP